jgi:hypothetical protein
MEISYIDVISDVIPTSFNISSDADIIGLAQSKYPDGSCQKYLVDRLTVVLPFIPLPVFEETVALDPLSLYPNTAGVGGTEWKRATEIASDIFERCPGHEWIRNVTKYTNTWKC